MSESALFPPTTNSITSSSETPQTPSQDAENQEQAELSEVDLGNKGQQDFDELISFSHTFNNYRICHSFATMQEANETSLGLLMSNEFVLAGTITPESFSQMSNADIVRSVRNKNKQYNDYDISNKANFIDNIPFFTKEIGLEQTVDLILPIVSNITKEKDAIIERFLNIFPKFIELIAGYGDEGYIILRDHIVTILRNIFEQKKEDKLLGLCGDDLVAITKYIKEEDKGSYILTIVIVMAHDDENENNRVLSVKLFNELALIIGQELCELYVVPQVASFADDQSCLVRKAVATYFINICEAVSKECFNHRLLPVYQKISKDSLWTVRNPAVKILPKLTKLCDSKTVSTVLIDIFKTFSQDPKIFVKYSAIEIFGEFISLLNKEDKDNYKELLNFYVSTINESSEKPGKKDDTTSILEKCAFNFPAILQFYGKESWDTLKVVYKKMAQEKEEKIRLTLAASMGEVSKILGPELTESDLVDFVSLFFKGNESTKENKEIQIKILGVLPDIIRNITSNQKNIYLDYLKTMITPSNDKWRRRLAYAKTIGKYHNTYSDEMIYKRVFPIAINFCFDDVSQVRMKAARHNSMLLLQLLSSETEFSEKTYKIFKSFAQSINFNYRQLFIRMCTDLVSNQDLYDDKVSDLLLDLAFDRVINVRIALAKFIKKILKKESNAWLKKDETMRKIVSKLRTDKSTEIKNYLKDITDVEDIQFNEIANVNEKFTDNMSFISDEFGITKNVPLKSKIKPVSTPSGETTPGAANANN